MSAIPQLQAATMIRSARASVALRIHPALAPLALGDGVVVQQMMDARIAPVPMCAPWFRGVARHAGQIVPFFDLAAWAGAAPARDERGSVCLAIAAGDVSLGVLASESPVVLPPGRIVLPWSGGQDWLAQGSGDGLAFRFDPVAWLREVAPAIATNARHSNSH